MKRSDNRGFATQLMICLIVTIGYGGSIALTTVWMRHRNFTTAISNRHLAAQIADVNRRITEMTAELETAQSAEMLRYRNAEQRIGMAPATEAQVMRVSEDPVGRLAARLDHERLAAESTSTVTFRLVGQN